MALDYGVSMENISKQLINYKFSFILEINRWQEAFVECGVKP